MKEQNFKNHARLVTGFHGFTAIAVIAFLGGTIQNILTTSHDNLYSASLLCLAAIIFLCFFWYMRSFALKAQDRAIRAEENFRYFILTGKPFNKNLKLQQIIALRFASDDEFVALTEKALSENLSNTDIKKLIQNWRADYDRA